jgi:hypothetical protein
MVAVSPSTRRKPTAVRQVLENDEVRSILRDGFFSPKPAAQHHAENVHEDVPAPDESARRSTSAAHRAKKPTKKAAKERPDHYKVICISMYNDDLALLDRTVKELKKRGFTKANRSAVLRAAMQQFDPSKVTKGL